MPNLVSVAPVLLVSDMDRSLSHYRNVMGFETDFNYEGTYVSVRREGCHLHLKKAERTRDQQAFEAAEHIDACFNVSDAPALASQLANAGATFSTLLRRSPYGTEFCVKDPDGYILAFVQGARD
jgi:predicted enzyme related to lactoylglutathione lyase